MDRKFLLGVLLLLSSYAYGIDTAHEEGVCGELGFVKGTQKFGACVIELYGRRDQARQANPAPRRKGDGSRDDRTCQSYGYSPSTAGYSDCRMRIDTARREAAAAQARYAQEKKLYDEQLAAIERQKRKDRGMRQLELGLCMLAGGCGSSSSSSQYQYTPSPPPPPSNFNLFLSNGRSVTCMHNHNVIDCR